MNILKLCAAPIVAALSLGALAEEADKYQAIKDNFRSKVASLNLAHGDQGKFGEIQIGQIAAISGTELTFQGTSTKCNLLGRGDKVEDWEEIKNLIATSRAIEVNCEMPLLSANQEFKAQLINTGDLKTLDGAKYAVWLVDIYFANPSEEKLGIIGTAIARKWGVPKAEVTANNSKNTANKIATACDAELGALESMNDRMANAECRSKLARNPLVQFISSSGDYKESTFEKNGVKVILNKKYISFRGASGHVHNLTFYDTAALDAIRQFGQKKKQIDDAQEKKAQADKAGAL